MLILTHIIISFQGDYTNNYLRIHKKFMKIL
nr:MAG TPA: hypothetical protein [Caudoviricetes sp.]